MKQQIGFLLISILLTACPQPPVPPPQTVDAGIEEPLDAAAPPATCATWCKHAAELKCSAAQPTKAGAPCSEVCNNVQTGPVKWNLRCRISARSCAEADACPPQ